MSMSEIINLNERRQNREQQKTPPVITLMVDGAPVEYVNLDALSPAERLRVFSESPDGVT
jgi:hypothetical protein